MVDLNSLDSFDVEKLHNEVLQLRSQQFFIGTLALAGSGATAWIGPVLALLAKNPVSQFALIGFVFSWLLLLCILYYWALTLRRIIAIISLYLELRGLSQWEPDFRKTYEENKRLFPSQTIFVSIIFAFYGILAILGAFFASDIVSLNWFGISILSILIFIYPSIIFFMYHQRQLKDSDIKRAWMARTSVKKAVLASYYSRTL